MIKYNIIIPIAAALILFFQFPGFAAEIDIPSSFNPVGSGARALAQGGAFIAVADDATAASWNPAGLIQLTKPEVSAVATAVSRQESIHFDRHPNGGGSKTLIDENLNYLSAVYPFMLIQRNMVVSLNYQHLYDFNREWDFTFVQTAGQYYAEDRWEFRQNGRLSALGVSYCVNIVPALSFGLTLNVWDDEITPNRWEKHYTSAGSGSLGEIPFTNAYKRTDDYKFSGFNAVFGLLWNFHEKATFGAVLKTPFTADIDHDMTKTWDLRYPDYPDRNDSGKSSDSGAETIDMPMSYGIGLLFHLTDNLYISTDIYRTEWDDFVYTDVDGAETSPVSNLPVNRSDVDPTHQIRIGSEYLAYKHGHDDKLVIPLRFGVFYDPAPAEGHADDYFGFAAGFGITKNGYFSIDAAYQFRRGNDVGSSIMENHGFSMDVEEHTFYISGIWYKF